MSQVSSQTSEKLEVKETGMNENTMQEPQIEKGSEKAASESVNEELIVPTVAPLAFGIIKAPKICPPGYRLDGKGNCRRIL